MKLEKQVCSLELSQKLKELGVKQESLFYWNKYTYIGERDGTDDERKIGELDIQWTVGIKKHNSQSISAFTVAELGELVTCTFHSVKFGKKDYGVSVTGHCNFNHEENEANAVAKMLIYLLENKLIISKEIK